MLEEMRSFVLLAEEGSIQKVAERLPLTQPAVTRQIQRLEQALGVKLLDRRQKPPRLTPAGEEALGRSRAILAAYADLRGYLQRAEPAGLLRLGVADGLADARLAATLAGLRKRYPQLSLRIAGGGSEPLGAQLERGLLDAALLLAAPTQARTDTAGITTLPLGRERLAVVAAPGLIPRGRAQPQHLATLAWVLNPEPCDARRRLAQALSQHGERLRVAAEVHNPALQLALVRTGLGPGLMPLRLAAKAGRGISLLKTAGLDLDFEVQLRHSPHLPAHAPVMQALAVGVRAWLA